MDDAILQDLHEKLHAEHKHITTKALAIEHSIPRSTAASLLEAVPYFDLSDECTYEITRCVFEKVGDKYGKLFARLALPLIEMHDDSHRTQWQSYRPTLKQ